MRIFSRTKSLIRQEPSVLERKIRNLVLVCRKLSLTQSRSTPTFDLKSFLSFKVLERKNVLIKDDLVEISLV